MNTVFSPLLVYVCKGVIFESVEVVEELMAKATTKTGLKRFTTILDTVYSTGQKVADDFKETMPIVFDKLLPQSNYVTKPQLF